MAPVTADTRPARNGPMLRHTSPDNSEGLIGVAAVSASTATDNSKRFCMTAGSGKGRAGGDSYSGSAPSAIRFSEIPFNAHVLTQLYLSIWSVNDGTQCGRRSFGHRYEDLQDVQHAHNVVGRRMRCTQFRQRKSLRGLRRRMR